MSNQQKFTAFSFDATQVEPQKPMEPVPAGFYPVQITDGELKPTADGTGLRLLLEFSIIDGPYKGRKVFDGVNLKNASAQAEQIGQQQLSAICHSTGVLRLQDVRELFGKPFSAKIGMESARKDETTGKEYEARNNFKGAKSLEGPANGAPASAPSSGAPIPGWAQQKAAASSPSMPPPVATPPPPTTPPFAQAPVPPPAAPKPPTPPAPKTEKRLKMTDKAQGMSAEDFRKSDAAWTDALLVSEGYAIWEEVVVTPSAPSAPAAPSGAPVPPPWVKKP